MVDFVLNLILTSIFYFLVCLFVSFLCLFFFSLCVCVCVCVFFLFFFGFFFFWKAKHYAEEQRKEEARKQKAQELLFDIEKQTLTKKEMEERQRDALKAEEER